MWERDKNNVKGDEVYHFNKFPPFLLPFYFPHMFHMVFNSLSVFMSISNLILQYHVDMKKAHACYLVLENNMLN
jgi:hypothetical protein